VKVIINQGSKKLEAEVVSLHDEVVTLKMAIEKAIRQGQRSMDDLGDIRRPGLVSNRSSPSPA
jgi:hypothetical protein